MAEVNFLVKKGLTVPKGSASTPSVIFDASDPNTGLYSPGADQVAVATNGTGRLYIASDGKVGVGTASPSEALEAIGVIRSTRTGSTGYYFRGYRSSTTSSFYIYDDGTDIQLTNEQSGALKFHTANTERLRITSAGLVGIGTSAPQTLLEVDNGTPTGTLPTLGGLLVTNAGTAATTAVVCVATGLGPIFNVMNNGRVGIGTTSPASRLTVSDGTTSGLTPFGDSDVFIDSSGDNYLQFGSGSSSSPAIYFGDSADGDVGGIIYSHASDFMSFRTNAAERARIDSSGRLLVGTSSAQGSAILQTDSTTLGFLPPRMTTAQRDAISSPAAGLMVYNTSTNKLNFYNGTAWEAVTSA